MEQPGNRNQAVGAVDPTVLPAKPKEEDAHVEVRDGKIFLGEEHGWANPEEMLAKVKQLFNVAVGSEKPPEWIRSPKIFSRLSLMLIFGLTKKEWSAIAKLPGFDRVCEMISTMSEAYLEKRLCDSADRNPAGAIFALKNSHDWRDQPETPVGDAAADVWAAIIRLPQKRTPQISGENP